MNLNKLAKTFLILTVFFLWLPMQAQVTVGSNEEPVKGALFQIKDTEGITNGAKNASKGLAFPRVELSLKNRLYPMFGTSDATATEDYNSVAKRTAVGEQHTGLVVYNTYVSPGTETDDNKIFQEGLYVWLGDKWASAGTPSVENGLTLTSSGVVQLGGKLTKDTEIDVNGKVLTIAAEEEKFFITGLEEGSQTDSRALVVDMNTGKVGTAPTVPAILTFVQSRTPYSFNPGVSGAASGPGKNGTLSTGASSFETTLNTGKKIVVPFSTSDIVTDNKLTTFDAANNAFTLIGSGSVEISGYINYYCGHADGDEVTLNLTIQVRENIGTPEIPAYGSDTWVDYSSVRAVWVGAQPYYRNTMTVPPAIYEGKTGDQIRMIIVRPYDVTGTTATFLGGKHGLNAAGQVVSFAIPYGTKFSKGLKIIAQ